MNLLKSPPVFLEASVQFSLTLYKGYDFELDHTPMEKKTMLKSCSCSAVSLSLLLATFLTTVTFETMYCTC